MSIVDKSVLLIDDDQEHHKIVEKILTNVGISVYRAATVKEAFEVIKAKCPHVIITDLNMEPESGFEFLQQFKTDPTTGNIPIIVLSARTERDSIHKALALGAKEYLTKPLEAALVLQKIRKLIRSKEFSFLEYPLDKMPKITMKIPAIIVGGNENGVQVETPVRLARDASVTLESPAIAPMDFSKPPTVRSSEKIAKANERGGFVNEVRFLGLLETQIVALRGIIEKWNGK